MEPYEIDLIKDVRSLIRYHRSIGLGGYCRNDETNNFIRGERFSSISTPKSSQRTVGRQCLQSCEGTLADICNEIANCHICELAKRRIISVVGRGSRRAKLFVVGEWLALPADGEENSTLLFGHEEDAMLSRMVAAINLREEDVFVTNLIKCGLDSTTPPSPGSFQSCLPYLHRQIGLVQPQVICTMGPVVTQLLLQNRQSLSQLRGRFHNYSGADEQSIPVMPTYHPSYLLKNEEMKKVTWLDLQAISRRLNKNQSL